MKAQEYEGNIGLVGPSGSGKSTLAWTLLEALGWHKVIDVGEFFREELRKHNQSVQKGDPIPLSCDKVADGRTVSVLQHEHQTVLVGRTVTWLARREQKHRRLRTPYVGASVQCVRETLVDRAYLNWNAKNHLPPETPLPSRERVAMWLNVRDQQDLERYRKLYKVTSAEELYGVGPDANDVGVWSDRMNLYEEVGVILSYIETLSHFTSA